MKRSVVIILFSSFVVLLALNIGLSFLMQGPIVVPDEGCIMVMARNLAQNFSFLDCKDIINAPYGNPPLLFPYIYSVFYFFFSSVIAYKAILIFHSLLISSLLFPLYGIIRRYINSHLQSIILASAITLLPPIFVFSKTALTETLFYTTNIWFLFFYLKSFDKKDLRSKIFPLLLAIIAFFLRPFGFITLLSFIINEFILAESKKKWVFLIMFIAACLSVAYFIEIFFHDFFTSMLLLLINPNNWLLLLKAGFNQLNSLNIATFTLPLIFFAAVLFDKKAELSKKLGKIKYFLLALILTNFLIGWIFLFRIAAIEGEFLNLAFRYINVSVIFVLLFGTISILQVDYSSLGKKFYFIAFAFLVSMLFLKDFPFRDHFLLDYVHLGIPALKNIFLDCYAIFVVFSFFLIVCGRKKSAVALSVLVLLTHSSFAYYFLNNFSNYIYDSDRFYHFFKEKNSSVLSLYNMKSPQFDSTLWNTLLLTDNHIENYFYNPRDISSDTGMPMYGLKLLDMNYNSEKIPLDLKKYDYVMVDLNLSFPAEIKTGYRNIYKLGSTPQ